MNFPPRWLARSGAWLWRWLGLGPGRDSRDLETSAAASHPQRLGIDEFNRSLAAALNQVDVLKRQFAELASEAETLHEALRAAASKNDAAAGAGLAGKLERAQADLREMQSRLDEATALADELTQARAQAIKRSQPGPPPAC